MIGPKHMGTSDAVSYVAKDHSAIRPEHFARYLDISLFNCSLMHTERTAAVNSGLGTVTDFKGVTRAFPITKEQ